MNMLVTLDSNYIRPLCVLLTSIGQSNPDTQVDLYVAHSSLTSADFNLIECAIDENKIKVHYISVDPKLLADAPVLKRITKETYYRLLATDYLPKDIERILYIDPDTVIINPIEQMYNMDLGDNLIAAAGHTTGIIELANKTRLGLPGNTRYINAGVMLMNIAQMRKEISTDKLFRFIKRNHSKLLLGDQDVINALFYKKIIYFDETIYNLDDKTYNKYKRKIDLDFVRESTVIIHYNGSKKPWRDNYDGKLGEYYDRYNEIFNEKLKTKGL